MRRLDAIFAIRAPWSMLVPDRWVVQNPHELEWALEWAHQNPPIRLLAFVHWGWTVPEEVLRQYCCLGFHASPLPDGAGGSPIQHEILAGKRETALTVFRMTADRDAGPVILEEPFSLEGRAEEIYVRLVQRAVAISDVLSPEAIETAQDRSGSTKAFRWRPRRTSAESRIPEGLSFKQLYDFLRMLDATGYPHAYFDWREFRLELSRVSRTHGGIQADVLIRKRSCRHSGGLLVG